MKRALSLIIVLAMVLCMIPFSAFAEANFNVDGDFVDGDIILDANDRISYLWTATETGTLEVFANPVVPEAVEGEEPTTLPEALIYINGAAYTEGGVSVVEGKSYEISFEDNNSVGGKVTVWAKFTGLIGTETNPYIMWNPAVEGEDGIDFPENNSTTTIEIAANESVFYMLHFYQGYNVTFTGNGVKVSVLGKTVDGTEAGFVTMAFENDPTMFKEVLVKFTNKSAEAAAYTVTAELPNNPFSPLAVTDGEYTATMVEGDDGYYYSYTAAEAGILNITVNAVDAEGQAIGWIYQADNVTAGAYGDKQWSDSVPVVNPAEVAVSAGDVVQVMVNTYDPANEWTAPAGVITTTFELVDAPEEPPVDPEPEEPTALVLGDNSLLIANGATNTYTYTPESDGVLTATVTAMDPAAGMIDMIFGMGNMTLTVNGVQAMGPSVEANVTAGTPVEIVVSNVSMGQDETITLNLAVAEPAGPGESEETAIAIELPWEVTHTGEHDMYYTYTATEDCIVKVTSTAAYTLGISGVESKAYDSLTKYVELATGDTIIINTYSSEDCTYSASIVDALPAGNGSYYFPYVIENLPYTSDINNGDVSLYYSYTAAKAATLVFSSENMGAVNVTLNGAWDVLDAENKLVVAAGDVVTINTYEGAFTVDYVPPVAVIGDAEYTTIDAAVAAAVSGDTIVLKDSVVAEAGIVLPAGANLDLGTYTLTAPYVVAFTGSEIVGDVASAAIVASNLVADNVTISDVEYTWTAGEDGAYTLVEVVPEEPELPPVVEEPKVAEYNGQTYSLTEAIALAAAKASKGNEQTVKLIAAYNNPLAQITIEPYVILDTGACDITAKYIIGLTGSSLQNTVSRFNGAIAEGLKGAIYVAEGNMALSSTVVTHNPSVAFRIMPVWLPEKGCYAIMPLRMNDDDIGHTYENDTVGLNTFYHQGGNATKANYLFKDNGSTDHGLRFVIRAEWSTNTGSYVNDYTYLDTFVKGVASGTGAYTYSISGIMEVLKWNPELGSFKLTPMIISDCGAIYYGDTIEITGN